MINDNSEERLQIDYLAESLASVAYGIVEDSTHLHFYGK